MRPYSLLASLALISLASLNACGGAPKEAESADSAEEKSGDEPSSDESASKDESSASDESAEKDEKDAEEEKKDEPSVTRSPKDLITAPDLAFMFSFNDSEPKAKAEEKCTAQSKDDPKKMAQCMTKERAKFDADGMMFKQNDKGAWEWLTLRRKGSKIITLHRIEFEFGDEKKDGVTLKTSGKDRGSKPYVNVPRTIEIEVPNEFQIAIQDPTHGRLVYEAKIGIFANESDGKPTR
jgi:hypothetical protein